MPRITTYAPGTFCWADLATHDTAAALRFYTSLFGWTAEAERFGPGDDDVYLMLRRDGLDVAALYRMDPTQQAQGVAPAWLGYVAVESAAEATARARLLGGSVLADAFEVMDFGTMSLLADPEGAVVAAWQGGRLAGAGVQGEPGTLCWHGVGARDPEATAAFYAGLFGWTPVSSEDADAPYTTFVDGGEPVGALFPITPAMGDMPSMWTPYFAVEDADAAVARAVELGGTVLRPLRDLPPGRRAVLRDPQGATFSILRPAQRNS